MTSLLLLLFRSFLAGCALAIVWWLLAGRRMRLPGNVAAACLVAGLAALTGQLAALAIPASPLWSPSLPPGLISRLVESRFALPLALGVLCLIVLVFPVRLRNARGAADLTRRTPLTFGRAWWFAAPLVVVAAIVALTIVAGAASQPDEQGHYRMYSVHVDADRSMWTGIYGWYYSVPSLILLGVLIAGAVATLALIARPAFSDNKSEDMRVRTARTRNVLAIATGSLLLHLGQILASLAGTASLTGGFTFGWQEFATFRTTFAALAPALSGCSLLAAVLGTFLWASVALSAIPSRRRAPVTTGS